MSNLRNTCCRYLSALNIFKAALKELNQVQESLVADVPAGKGLVQEYYDLTTEEQEIINCPEKKIIPCFAGALQSGDTLTIADLSIAICPRALVVDDLSSKRVRSSEPGMVFFSLFCPHFLTKKIGLSNRSDFFLFFTRGRNCSVYSRN